MKTKPWRSNWRADTTISPTKDLYHFQQLKERGRTPAQVADRVAELADRVAVLEKERAK